MTKQDTPELRRERIKSLNWAIGELTKEKDDLGERISEASRCKEAEELIDETLAKKEALEQRARSLREGLDNLRAGHGDGEGLADLEEKDVSLEERLAVAKERLSMLERDEALDQIARNLGGEEADFPLEEEMPEAFTTEASDQPTENEPILTETMSETNRIPSVEGASAESPVASVATAPAKPRMAIATGGTLACSEETTQGIHEAAAAIDLDPEHVLEKSMQAVLRMIARNGNRMTFPLEVKQVESLG